MEVTLINRAGIKKECPTGFSGTTLFFGFLVPLVRGDFVGMIIHLLVTLVSVGFAWFIWPFFYNKSYINRLLEKGYMPYSEDDVSRLQEMGISVDLTYEPPRKTEEEKVQTRIPMPESAVQKPVEPVADDRAANTFDLSTMISLSWPVELESGSLLKSDGANSRETLSCSFEIKNVQTREILYTQWQLECFDILKKPIFTEIPVIVRHELNFGPEETVVVALSEGLPPGTRSFTPHLKAVLYADQTVDEFADDEVLISWKPRTKIADIEGFSESALSYYQQRHNLKERPKFLHEKIEEFIWTCAFCGTRNQASARKCRLCSTVIAQQELCTREKIEQSFVEHKVQQEQIAEENRKKLEEDERKRLQEEERRKAEEAKKAQENYESKKLEREKNKARLKKSALIAVILIVVAGIGFTLWTFVLKPMNEYLVAEEYFQEGKYYQAYEDFNALGNYKDAGDKALDSYAAYLGTIPVNDFTIDMYQWLLDSGYPQEKIFAILVSILNQTNDLNVLFEGYQWLLDRGYPQEKVFATLVSVLDQTSDLNVLFEGYQWLLDRGYPQEKVFATLVSVLDQTSDLNVLFEGYQWLLDRGYPQESLYELAGGMVEKGRFFEGYKFYRLLDDFKDSQAKAASLAVNVTLDLQGGRLGEKHDGSAMIAMNLYDTLPPTREGYVFDGWWTGKRGTGEQVLLTTKQSIAPDQTLYANWLMTIQVGSLGPAGGYVFYDKGSYSAGWRYLEAAPAAYEYRDKFWGGYGTAVGGTGTAIGTGKLNTEKIVSKFGYAEPYGKKTDYAAKLCSDLKLTKDGVVYDDWFLPSKDELNQMYQNLHKNNLGGFSDDVYWSSSEGNTSYAWRENFYFGLQNYDDRTTNDRVRPVRAF